MPLATPSRQISAMAPSSPFRALPAERRVALVTHVASSSREGRAHYIQRLIARGGGFRAVTLNGWPVDKLAREVVRLNAQTVADEMDLLHTLYVELEPAIQIAFLTAAGVQHADGVIDETLEPPFADAGTVAMAAVAVRDAHGEAGLHYRRTIARYNPAAWPGLGAALASLEAGA